MNRVQYAPASAQGTGTLSSECSLGFVGFSGLARGSRVDVGAVLELLPPVPGF